VDGVTCEVDPGRGTAPLLIDNRTLIPIRALVEALGGTVEWDADSQKITLDANGHIVEMWVGEKAIIVDEEGKDMDVAPVVINDRTMVPVRFATENLGFFVGWDEATSAITVATDPIEDAPILPIEDENAATGTETAVASGAKLPDKSDLKALRSYIMTLVPEVPVGGKKISRDELYDILEPYYKEYSRNGDSSYEYSVDGDFVKNGVKWEMDYRVRLRENWFNFESEGYMSYDESFIVFDEYDKDKEGLTTCSLSISDDSFYYDYSWIKGEKEGELDKFPRKSSNDNYDPKEIPESFAILYDDQVIDGQLCKVYRIVFSDDDETMGTSYYWFSTVSGETLMIAYFSDGNNSCNLDYIFESKYVATGASFYVVPKDIHFVETSYDY